MARLIAIAFVTATCSCGRPSSQSEFVIQPPMLPASKAQATPLFTIDLQSSSERLRPLTSYRVRVNDPVYRRQKTYEGYRLSDVVDQFAARDSRVSDDGHLVMVCLDGYRASLTMGAARSNEAVLAIRDVDGAVQWEPFPAGGTVGSPAPFYLVWVPRAMATASELPWPYGVVAIEVWSSDPLNVARPSSTNANAMQGFDVFVRACINCHRVNGAGGTLSTELNVPVNVTEYWNRLALRQFIRDPSSVRAGATMAAITGFREEDIDAVMIYLEHMKYRKVTPD